MRQTKRFLVKIQTFLQKDSVEPDAEDPSIAEVSNEDPTQESKDYIGATNAINKRAEKDAGVENKHGTVKLMSVNSDGKKFQGIPAAWYEFVEQPFDKTGTRLSTDINRDVSNYPPQKAMEMEGAVRLFDKALRGETLSVEEMGFILKYLPIKVSATENAFTFLGTWTESWSDYWKNKYVEFDMPMRARIVDTLLSGSDASLVVAYQKPGMLVHDRSNGVQENNLKELPEFKDKTPELLVLDGFGNLINSKGEIVSTVNSTWAGQIFTTITAPNGQSIPIKLNRARIQENEASMIYDLFEYVVKAHKRIQVYL